jgi:hypothetical protein
MSLIILAYRQVPYVPCSSALWCHGIIRLDGVAKERKATGGTLRKMFGVGVALVLIIEVQHEADAGYLSLF